MGEQDVRLSGPTLKALKVFLEQPRERRSGAEISRETGIGSGTLYPLLARLERLGWLVSEWETINPRAAGRPRRRLYTLTAIGQTRARAALADFQVMGGIPAWNA